MVNDLEKHPENAIAEHTGGPDNDADTASPVDSGPADGGSAGNSSAGDSSAGVSSAAAPQPVAAKDRRAMRRAKTDLFVNRFLNGHPYLCRMTDISLSGARLVAINEPRINPPPSYMGLQFQLPGRREVITASGEAVTRADGHAVGVRFTRLPAAAAAAIEALLGAP